MMGPASRGAICSYFKAELMSFISSRNTHIREEHTHPRSHTLLSPWLDASVAKTWRRRNLKSYTGFFLLGWAERRCWAWLTMAFISHGGPEKAKRAYNEAMAWGCSSSYVNGFNLCTYDHANDLFRGPHSLSFTANLSLPLGP